MTLVPSSFKVAEVPVAEVLITVMSWQVLVFGEGE
jgi:hypothetical protein